MMLRHGLSIILLLLITAGVYAEDEIETLQLQNRTAEEIIPTLQPFVRAGGSLSGSGYTLIIRSTPENIDEIKRLLADIDTQLKQMLITVATMAQIEQSQDASRAQVIVNSGEVSVAAGGNPSASGTGVNINTDTTQASVQVQQTRQRQTVPGMQQMRVVEGTWGSIQMGQQIPVMSRVRNADGTVTATMTYKNVTSGFHVLPRVNNDNITLIIRPHKANLSQQGGGAIDIQSMDTTVTGKLGQWISIGGSTTSKTVDANATTHATRTRESSQDQLYVKVEVLSQ